MASSPESLAQLRLAWRCDCDGTSHVSTETPRGGVAQSIAGLKDHIKEITGYAPLTCPWRVFYDPLVAAVLRVTGLGDSALVLAELGDDPPGVILDGVHSFLSAKNATRAHYAELERKERDRKRPR